VLEVARPPRARCLGLRRRGRVGAHDPLLAHALHPRLGLLPRASLRLRRALRRGEVHEGARIVGEVDADPIVP
jgi:hypothetical protein